MTATARDRRDRLRAMLADLKMPGALEAVDGVLAKVDSGAVTASEAIEQVLGAQIALRNNRRLQAAMRSSRLPAVKTLAQFDFTFQPSIKREQIESLHELGFLDRRENVILLGPPGVTAVRRATLRWRIISTAPSAVFGMAVDWPARTDRAAVSASTVSDFPAIRRVRRSPRFTSSTWCPARRTARRPEETQRGMTQVLIRDHPGSSGMTPGCDSREDNNLGGSGDTIVVQDF